MAEEKKTKKDEKDKPLRVMPNSVEAEESVLGALLIDDAASDAVMPMLIADDFFVPANRTIFAAMKDLQEHSKPIDTVSVADALELQGKLDEVGNIAYISSLAEQVPSAANVKYYAEIIKRDSLTRRVIHAGNDIVQYAYGTESGKDALGYAEQLVYGLSEANSDRALVHAQEALSATLKSIQAVQSGNVPKNVIYTDFPTFDRMTKGLKPGEFIILAARPSVGKTALALNIAANVCMKGKTVAIFNMEMTAPLLVKRMLAYVSGVTFEEMDTRGQLSDDANGRLFSAYNRLLATPLYIDDYSLNTPSDILSKCRRLKHDKGLDLVVVDYLQLMEAESKGRSGDSRQNEVSDMSRKLKIFAKELDVPILALSQMSRGVEKEGKDREPQLSDLRDSGAIEQDADVVAFLHDPSKADPTKPKNEIVFYIRKNRNGPTDKIMLDWTGNTTTFREIPQANAAAGSAPAPSAAAAPSPSNGGAFTPIAADNGAFPWEFSENDAAASTETDGDIPY